jgi:hypothetical protein
MSNRAIQRLFQTYHDALVESGQPLKNLKAIDALTHCRTREMGVSMYQCADRHEPIEQFHSCRHRSCHVCSQRDQHRWVEKQKAKLLDTAHFHVIFTIPHEYTDLWRYNESLMSRLLFRAGSQTLLELFQHARGGPMIPGILIALHTWGRQLNLHPHLHCLVTAGGLEPSGKWKELGNYLAPGKVLRTVFRGKFQALLRNAMQAHELELPPDQDNKTFWKIYRSLYAKDWNVRVEERYEHGKGVLIYLARYCKGGPLNPKQLSDIYPDRVQMRYLDHRDKRVKTQSLPPMTLLKRLLMHVPAMNVHTVRHYGLYAAAAKQKWQTCAEHLGTLMGMNVPHSLQPESMLLACRKCGSPTNRVSCFLPRRRKGISPNNSSLRRRAGGYVQPDDQLVSPRRSGVPDSLNQVQPDVFLPLGCKLSKR